MKVLVTGASGFVGRHVVAHLRRQGIATLAAYRAGRPLPSDPDAVVLRPGENDRELLRGVDCLIHAAGVAHRPESRDPAALEAFQEGNVGLTERLAEAVRDSSVRLMVHISSIAAAGYAGGERETPIAEEDSQEPTSAYGRSKRLAEEPVSRLAEAGKLGINLRPPLIYGPGAGGNWARLTRLARLPLPLPFGRVEARRSYLGITNLCDLLHHLATFPPRPEVSGTYHLADTSPLSLREVVSALREGAQRSPALWPVPPSWMKAGLVLLGRERMARGLFGELVVESSRLRETFAWSPPQATWEGMAACGAEIRSGASPSEVHR